MAQAVGYSGSEDRMLDSEQEAEIDGVDPWKAAMQGDLDALLQYIDDNGDVNQRDRDNNTPLHWACQESHFDIVGVLMSRNAAVDPVNDLQSTPLHYACREGNLDIVTGLINFNANLEARNKDNLSPLHVAAGMGHIEVTKRLLDNGAQMEAKDNALYTPLWRASYYGHPEVVEVLLLKGADKQARNKKGRKPGDVFSPQVEEESKERIKMMLDMGVPHANRDPEPPNGSMPPGVSPTGSRGGREEPETRGPAAEPPPYKVSLGNAKPPVSATSGSYYPDPSPANSPSSIQDTLATPLADPMLNKTKQNDLPPGRHPVNGVRGPGDKNEELPSAGVRSMVAQTTPSINGAAEMDHLKSELEEKNRVLQRMSLEIDDYKKNLQKAQADSTEELDNADLQMQELNQRVVEAEKELARKRGEVGEARKEIEDATRKAENRIAQLEQDLQAARSSSGGCNCTIS